MTWWLWLVLSLVALIGVFRWALVSYRRRVQAEFLEFLAAEAPDLQVVETQRDALTLRLSNGQEGDLYLGRMYDAVAKLDSADTGGRRKVFQTLVGAMRESGSLAGLSAGEFRARLRPRVVSSQLRSMLEEEAEDSLVNQALGAGDLFVMVVLDSPNSVRYLTKAEVSSFGFTPETCIRAAIGNLASGLPVEVVERALRGETSVINSEDGYAAGRLLVVPQLLEPGQRLLAVIPNEGDGLVLRSLPRDPSHRLDLRLITDGTPVAVTRDGFEAP